jgi:hypothetical protein
MLNGSQQDGGSTEHHAHGAQKNYDLHISALPSNTSVAQITIDEPELINFSAPWKDIWKPE